MDPFREFFLQQVQVILDKEPDRESLLELLRTTSPELTMDEVFANDSRSRALKVLKLRIHPDKHPQNDAATNVYQDVQEFYDCCCKNLTVTRHSSLSVKATSPERSVHFPLEFGVQDKWPFLDFKQPLFPEDVKFEMEPAALVAYQCINARGAIAHGRKTELAYDFSHARGALGRTAQEVFDSHGGTRILTRGVEQIKEELMINGPVVSVSFFLRRAFLNASEYASSFNANQIDNTHELLIVGWVLTAYGEMWLIRPLVGDPNPDVSIPIAFGQFGVDDVCLAPKNTFDNTPWQPGPYLDQDLSKFDGWRLSASIKCFLSSKELQSLSSNLGHGFFGAIAKRSRLVIRDRNKIAQSRACHLTEIEWNDERQFWEVSATFLD